MLLLQNMFQHSILGFQLKFPNTFCKPYLNNWNQKDSLKVLQNLCNTCSCQTLATPGLALFFELQVFQKFCNTHIQSCEFIFDIEPKGAR